MLGFLNNIGPTEIVVVIAILMLFFGGRFVTGLARSSGETVKEIKKIKKSIVEPIEEIKKDTSKND